MAKKLNKLRSLDEGEIILEEVPESEVVAWTDNTAGIITDPEPVEEAPYVTMEAKVSTDELTQADIKWAKANLSGHPNSFDRASTELLERLCRYGIAADFGDEGFGRGHKFFTV